jgi:hypothetical protein
MVEMVEMIVVNVEVRGGVAYVTLASASSAEVFVRIEDRDWSQTSYWKAEGCEVYEVEEEEVRKRVDEGLEGLEGPGSDTRGDAGSDAGRSGEPEIIGYSFANPIFARPAEDGRYKLCPKPLSSREKREIQERESASRALARHLRECGLL